MRYLFILIIATFSVVPCNSQAYINAFVNDTIRVKLSKKGNIESIKVSLSLTNNSESIVYLKKEVGTINEIPYFNICERYDIKGFGFSVSPKNKTELLFGMPPSFYFTSYGEIRYRNCNVKYSAKRRKADLAEEERICDKPSIMALEKGESVTFPFIIYMGDLTLIKGETYYIIFTYNNKQEGKLSKVCFETNRLVLMVQ